MTFERPGYNNADCSIPGELRVRGTAFPTIERGRGYTTVRRGLYSVEMSWKRSGRRIRCLRFTRQGIRALLIHAALNDDPLNLEGCIAPGMIPSESGGIEESDRAMEEIFGLLGGFHEGNEFIIWVRNNAPGIRGESHAWIRRRIRRGRL
jgi:hypothetical protein